MAAPISHNLTSIPDSLRPVFVESFTHSKSLSNLGLKATVKAQSIILPSTWVPKSILHTSSYYIVVKSPGLGV
jgi:hypothetical protein